MNTQQLAELLRTWPEFEGKPLDWLEQYPPDWPIMAALNDAPCGGDYYGDQWLSRLTWYTLSRLSVASKEFFERKTTLAYEVLTESERQAKKKWTEALGSAHENYDRSNTEAVYKAHLEEVWRAYDARYRAEHAALYKYIQDTNGLFESALDVLYDEYKDLQQRGGAE